MKDNKISEMEQVCRELTDASQGMLSWMWDDRFETALAQVSINDKDKVNKLLVRFLKNTWDSSNIKDAPDDVKAVSNNLGGIRSGQQLLTSDPNTEGFIYCSWWVWGDGNTISVRVAPYFSKASNAKKDEQVKLIKNWFGLTVHPTHFSNR